MDKKDFLLIVWAEFGSLVLAVLLILEHYFNKNYYFDAALFFGLGLINFVLVRKYFNGLTKPKHKLKIFKL